MFSSIFNCNWKSNVHLSKNLQPSKLKNPFQIKFKRELIKIILLKFYATQDFINLMKVVRVL